MIGRYDYNSVEEILFDNEKYREMGYQDACNKLNELDALVDYWRDLANEYAQEKHYRSELFRLLKWLHFEHPEVHDWPISEKIAAEWEDIVEEALFVESEGLR